LSSTLADIEKLRKQVWYTQIYMNRDDAIIAGRHCFPYRHLKTQNPAFAHLKEKPIAFFCAEYGIEENLPIYAGGLGILAGDFVLEAGEIGLPLVAIGLLYRNGFPTCTLAGDASDQIINPESAGFSLVRNDQGQSIVLDIEVDNTIVYAQVWVRVYGSAHVFLLDTHLERNPEEYRVISRYLYATDFHTKLLQDFVLGVGGIKLLRCLGITPTIYHLNEGHTAFVILALAVEYMHDHPDTASIHEALSAVRHSVVGTKHTILPGAGLSFARPVFSNIVNGYLARHRVNFDDFFAYGAEPNDNQIFSTTRLLLKGAVRANAVSLLHATFEKREHPHSKLLAITNGARIARWRSPRWGRDGLGRLADNEIWNIHETNRKNLVAFVKNATGVSLNPQALTITWARRFAAYKRPELLFADVSRMARILEKKESCVQILIAGEAHRADTVGQKLIHDIERMARDLRFAGRIVCIPFYNIAVAKTLVSGSDVWLSTPERGKEACGTSSMKAGLNGVLQFSTSDGWLEEVDWSDKGWILPDIDTAEHLYKMLEEKIMPMFYKRNTDGIPTEWVRRMRNTINLIEEYYGARRMLDDYIRTLYFPEKT